MNNRIYLITFILSAAIILWPSGTQAQYVPDDKILVARAPVTLHVPNAETLTIVYRPGSNISDTVRISLRDATYRWTPREAGLAAILTPEGPVQTVSVRFAEAPFWGYVIMFGAGFILFGGQLMLP